MLSTNFFHKLFFSEYELNKPIIFVINKGMSLNEISKKLKNDKIISNEFSLKLWTRINSLEKKLKFGEFELNNNYSINSLVNQLVAGQSINRYLTIPEGFSISQLKERLKVNFSNEIISNSINIPNNLIANTYSYNLHDTVNNIILNISEKSDLEIDKIWNSRNLNIPIKSKKEMIILASIIEKETGKKTERNKVAGVFMNRLKKGMRLQSDPTVIYAITNGKKMLRKLSRKDLKFISPFNTYLNKGLPPEPICIPGIESLKAVANPYNGSFLYFVSDNNGGHLFSEDYGQHLQNVKLFRKRKRLNE